ncbi:hypothetical protein [Massilia sp. DWR3-1-1]|uniref:hypothetical protein n=1 Tax=Massilia sp. DWR3-1-1 TaxID=2804559 RepID=UPI003CE6DD05
MRPSSALRIGRLDALLTALQTRDMTQAEAATLLQCSATCARGYVSELVAADLIVLARGPGPRRIPKPRYRLDADPCAHASYLALLRARAGLDLAPPAPAAPSMPLVGRRDPLVAALFGTPRHGAAQASAMA